MLRRLIPDAKLPLQSGCQFEFTTPYLVLNRFPIHRSRLPDDLRADHRNMLIYFTKKILRENIRAPDSGTEGWKYSRGQ